MRFAVDVVTYTPDCCLLHKTHERLLLGDYATRSYDMFVQIDQSSDCTIICRQLDTDGNNENIQ